MNNVYKLYNGDIDSAVNQMIKDKLVRREVLVCVSDMAEHLFHWDDDGQHYATYEEWDNYYIPVCPECGEHVPAQAQAELTEDEEKLFGGDAWKCPYCGHVEEIEPDAEPQEIYEYWIVTEWFGEKLKKLGEPVFERWGGWIWGRCTTGQAISIDYVVDQIAFDMKILDGMENCKSWKE